MRSICARRYLSRRVEYRAWTLDPPEVVDPIPSGLDSLLRRRCSADRGPGKIPGSPSFREVSLDPNTRPPRDMPTLHQDRHLPAERAPGSGPEARKRRLFVRETGNAYTPFACAVIAVANSRTST